jgi:hypothetical protein
MQLKKNGRRTRNSAYSHKGTILKMIVTSSPKVSFWPDDSTSSENYRWLFVFILHYTSCCHFCPSWVLLLNSVMKFAWTAQFPRSLSLWHTCILSNSGLNCITSATISMYPLSKIQDMSSDYYCVWFVLFRGVLSSEIKGM